MPVISVCLNEIKNIYSAKTLIKYSSTIMYNIYISVFFPRLLNEYSDTSNMYSQDASLMSCLYT